MDGSVVAISGWTDAALVEGLRRGDPASFDRAFERYRAPVYGFLVRMSGRPELAEELLQEVWVRLARHATRLRPDTNLKAWLFTVARNLWRSHQRWAWLDGERLLELARGIGSAPTTPLEHAEASEAGRRVEAALASMPATYREVALLVLVERMEPAEAAPILGLKPDAVRQRLARARDLLAEALPREEVR